MSKIFHSGDADAYFAELTRQALSRIEMKGRADLEGDLPDCLNEIAANFRLTEVTLGAASTQVDEVTLTDNRFSASGFYAPGQDVARSGTRLTVAVPFTGSRDLLLYMPRTRDFSPHESLVGHEEILLIQEAPDITAEQAKTWRDNELRRLNERVQRANVAVAPFNAQLDQQLTLAAERRLARLRKQSNLQDELNRS